MQSHGAAAGAQSEFVGSMSDILQDIYQDIMQIFLQDIMQDISQVGYPTRTSCQDIFVTYPQAGNLSGELIHV